MVKSRMQPGEVARSFQPVPDSQWPTEIPDMREGFAGQLNVYRVMAHRPALLRSWAGLREHIVKESALGPERAEIAILRIGFALNSDYEWGHHVSRARACGIADERIARMRGPLSGIDGNDAIVARAVDELLSQARLSPSALKELVSITGREAVLDLMATVGMYATLAFITNTFATPMDERVAKELRHEPLS